MENIINEIIAIERDMFERTQGCGVHAVVQDSAFFSLRSSRLLTWSRELLESYHSDLLSAQAEGRNLLCEKYAYMMEHTSPNEYAKMKDALPMPSMEKLWLADLICAASSAWQEALVVQYPCLTSRWTPIRKEDNGPMASFETHLHGELLTYSVESLRLYAALVDRRQKEGANLWEAVLHNAVSPDGCCSLEEAETRLREKMGGVRT